MFRRGSSAARATVGGATRAVIAAGSQLCVTPQAYDDPICAAVNPGYDTRGATTDRPRGRTFLHVINRLPPASATRSAVGAPHCGAGSSRCSSPATRRFAAARADRMSWWRSRPGPVSRCCSSRSSACCDAAHGGIFVTPSGAGFSLSAEDVRGRRGARAAPSCVRYPLLAWRIGYARCCSSRWSSRRPAPGWRSRLSSATGSPASATGAPPPGRCGC